jgi:hypothetical protein
MNNQNAITEPRPGSAEPVTGSTAGEVVELMFDVVLGLVVVVDVDVVDGGAVGVTDDETTDVDPSA